MHLGKLAAYLRMFGFDCDYSNNRQDEQLVAISIADKRILLTRDTALLKRKAVTHGYFIHEINPRRQVVEVMKRLDLFSAIHPFQRCLRCNGVLLASASGEKVAGLIPPDVLSRYAEFFQCQDCARVYWKGTHYQRMVTFIDNILETERNQVK